jgi:iron(III) transport system ATP-binding protein
VAKLQLSGLGKRFGDVSAVSGVDLALATGEFISLLGPSGCGKTTTLRMIAGFILPSEGSIAMDGAVLSTAGGAVPPEKRRMSMIFQSYAIWPNMTVAENVAFGLKLRKLSRAAIAEKVERILAVVHLDRLSDRYPAELSGGQQQRVALARAMVIEPEVLLLDEPLSNLDANLREEMRFEIRRLHDTYKYTTIYVTHDQVEAMTTADTIVVMNQGRVEQVGAPEDIYQRPRSEFVARFIGGTNIFRGRRIGADLIDCGALVLRCGAGEPAGNGETAVSVRLHDIALAPAGAPGDQRQPNEASGRIVRQAYLGSYRDYLVGLADGQQVRVTAPLGVNVPVGGAVRLRFPPEHCRALAR